MAVSITCWPRAATSTSSYSTPRCTPTPAGRRRRRHPAAPPPRSPASGKASAKKDLALMAMTYGHVYVARVAMGANDAHTLRVLREAEAYDGPSLVIAYSHCIAHGYDLRHGLDQQKAAALSGHWPLL